MDDTTLIAATLAGNVEAFGVLVGKYQHSLVASARHLTRSAEDAEDLAQEASGVRVEEYKLKSRVTLADVTVQITGKPAPKAAAAVENPVTSSAAASLHALAAFGEWLLTVILIPLGVWLPAWGPVLGITLYVRRRRLQGKR